MGTDGFNPYHQWLGLDPEIAQPNYYELLGIERTETDVERISAAAAIAMSRVRSFRPGERAAQWAKLLDEISAAKKCLTDPAQRADYDWRTHDSGSGSRRPAPRSRMPIPEPPAAETPPPGPIAVPPASPRTVPMSGPPAGLPPAFPPGSGPALPAQSFPPAPPQAAPYAYAPPGGQPPAYPPGPPQATPAVPVQASPRPPRPGVPGQPTPPAVAYGPTVPMSAPVPSAAPTVGYPAGPPAATPMAVPTVIPVSAPPAPNDEDPYGLGLQSVRHNPLERRKPAAVAALDDPESEGHTKLLGFAIALAAVLVLSGLGILVGVLLTRNHGDKDEATETRVSSKDRKSSGTGASSGSDKKKKEEATFKGTPQQEAAKKALEDAKSASGQGDSKQKKPGSEPPAETPSKTRPKEKKNRPKPDKPESSGTTAKTPTDPPSGKSPTEPKGEPNIPGKPDAVATVERRPSVFIPRPKLKTDGAAPTREDAVALARSLTTARNAVSSGNFEVASRELAKAEALPMSVENQAKYARLHVLAGYAKSFRAAMKDAVQSFLPGEQIEVGSSTVVDVVAVSADSLTIRVAGKNIPYALDQLPTGLALGIGDVWLKKGDPSSLVLKACYLATSKNAAPEQLAKARDWLKEAGTKGAEIGDLAEAVEEKYDLEKDDP